MSSEQIDLLACDALAPEEAEGLRRHIERCGTCRRRLDECLANEEFLGNVKHWPDADVLDKPPESPGPDAPGGSESSFDGPVPDSFPGYTIIREIHRGGQGVIYQAIQKTTKRRVAIKVMREGPFGGERDKARFEREVQILGALNHPHVVAVHESGSVGGSFYFVMDYISGQALDVYMASSERSIEEALRLFARICEAVNAAHLQGVIHRDLKPGNIRIDTDDEPRILDFGLAKVATGRITDDSQPQVMTVTGQFMGSLPWASPEQAEAVPGKIDVRTDVYSLGVILYQMLTGKFPYEVAGSMHEVLDNILKTEPTRPSSIRRQINDEVETIVLKCLAKERDRRYQTAGELARDVRRYLNGEPIEAKRDSALYVLKKMLRRYRARAAVAAGLAVVVTLALVFSLTFWRQAVQQRDEALAAENRARQAQLAEAEQRQEADRQHELAEKARAEAEERELLARRHVYSADMNLAFQAWQDRNIIYVVERLVNHIPLPGQEDLRTFDWYYLFGLSHQESFALWPHMSMVSSLAFSPAGKTLATSGDNNVKIWDLATKHEEVLLRGHTGRVNKVVFFPDGETLASVSYDCTVRLWDSNTGKEKTKLRAHDANVVDVAVSPDGGTLVAAAEGDTLLAWNVGEMNERRSVRTPRSFRVEKTLIAFRPDGKTFVTTYGDGTATLWDARTLQVLASFGQPVEPTSSAPSPIRRERHGEFFWPQGVSAPIGQSSISELAGIGLPAALSPDGETLALVGLSSIGLWDVATGSEIDSIPVKSLAIAFAPDGATLAIGAQDCTIRLWDLQKRKDRGSLVGELVPSSCLAFSPDGLRLASVGHTATVKVWDLTGPTEQPVVQQAHDQSVRAIAFSPDETTLVTASAGGSVKFWDTATWLERRHLEAHKAVVGAVGFFLDNGAVVTADHDGTVVQWDPSTGRRRGDLTLNTGEILSLAFSPDGRMLATGGSDGTIELWNVLTGQKHKSFRGDHSGVRAVAFSPDGETLASADSDWWTLGHSGSSVILWDVRTGQQRSSIGVPAETVACLAFSSDGSRLAAGSGRWTNVPAQVFVWDLSGPTLLGMLYGHAGAVQSVEFSPDARTLLSGGADQTLKIWDLAIMQERVSLTRESSPVVSLAFSRDGKTLISGNGDGTVTIRLAPAESEVKMHPSYLQGTCYLATLLRRQGRVAHAKQVLRETLDVSREHFGEHNPGTAYVMLYLGSLLSQGPDSAEYSEAASLLSGVLAFAQRHQFVDFHDLIVAARDALSEVTDNLGRLGEHEAIRLAVKRGGAKALIALGKASPEGVADAVKLASLIGAAHNPSSFDLLICGEYSLIGGKTQAGVGLIQQAVERGGQNHFYFKSLGWALLSSGKHEEAAAAFTKATAEVGEWPPTTLSEADPDHWTAAYFLDLVTRQQYTNRWRKDAQNGEKFACFPWFYVGQRMEIEGRSTEAIAAYSKSVELGRLPDAHHASNWAAYRLKVLANVRATSSPAP